MNCEQFRETLDAVAMGETADAHGAACPECARALAEATRLVALLEQAKEAPFAPPARSSWMAWAASILLALSIPGLWVILRSSGEPVVIRAKQSMAVRAEGGDVLHLSPGAEIVRRDESSVRLNRGELEWSAQTLSLHLGNGTLKATSTSVLKVSVMNHPTWMIAVCVLSGSAVYSESGRTALISEGQSLRISSSGRWFQGEDNPEYKAWAKFKVGARVHFSQQGRPGIIGVSQELIELTAEKAVVRYTLVRPPGTNPPQHIVTAEYPATREKAEHPKPKAEGQEELAIGGRKFQCRWIETETDLDGASVRTRTWTCDEIPGGTVQIDQELETAAGLAVQRTRLVEFKTE